MKLILFLKVCSITCILIFLTVLQLIAQTNANTPRLDHHSIVRNSEGVVFSSNAWQDSIKSGKYVIRPVEPENEKTEFLLLSLLEDYKRQILLNTPKPRESDCFTTGKTISNFSARDIQGEKYQLKSLRGKVVVLNFWFIACTPCQREIPELNKIVTDYKDSSNIVFISICLDEKEMIRKFLQMTSFDYAIVDNGRSITTGYGVKAYPTHVVLNKEGKVIFHTTGYGIATIPWLRKSIELSLK